MKRGAKWAAVGVALLAVLAAGGVIGGVIAHRSGHTATTTVTAPAGTITSAQLPYDPEENAFMGSPNGTGCLASDNHQAVCDCAYRQLRSEGYPASQLAAIGPDITSSDIPKWVGYTMGHCLVRITAGQP